MNRSLALAPLLALSLAPRAALADDDPPFTIGSQPVWFLLGGVTTGATVALADRGAFVGGELSLARLRDGRHVGIYADGYYDWGTDGAFATGGLEAGYKFIGADAGAALRFADGGRQLGATGRLSVGLGVFSLYVRYAFFDAMADEHVLQAGVTFKLPLATLGDGR